MDKKIKEISMILERKKKFYVDSWITLLTSIKKRESNEKILRQSLPVMYK